MTIIDPTGTPLTPSPQGKDCLGNGTHPEYPICCDECNYFLYCYPQFDPKSPMPDYDDESYFNRQVDPFGFADLPDDFDPRA